jgi:hypothetical protein
MFFTSKYSQANGITKLYILSADIVPEANDLITYNNPINTGNCTNNQIHHLRGASHPSFINFIDS